MYVYVIRTHIVHISIFSKYAMITLLFIFLHAFILLCLFLLCKKIFFPTSQVHLLTFDYIFFFSKKVSLHLFHTNYIQIYNALHIVCIVIIHKYNATI